MKIFFVKKKIKLNLWFPAVVNAAHSFYNGTTTLPISDEDRTPRKRISKTLNMTTSPEEKRKIIGDTFVKVMFICCWVEVFKCCDSWVHLSLFNQWHWCLWELWVTPEAFGKWQGQHLTDVPVLCRYFCLFLFIKRWGCRSVSAGGQWHC